MTDDKNRIRIFTASLNAVMPHKAYAVFDGTRIIVADIVPLQGGFSAWSDALISEVREKVASGWVALIEEKTDYVAQFGSKFDFEEESHEGKVNLYTALDYYFAIQNAGNVIMPDPVKRFLIRESHAEKLQDDKGRVKYSVNWEHFTGGHRALLLCVMAAVMEPVSDRYLGAFFGNFNLNIQPQDDGLSTVRSLVKAFGIEVQHGI